MEFRGPAIGVSISQRQSTREPRTGQGSLLSPSDPISLTWGPLRSAVPAPQEIAATNVYKWKTRRIMEVSVEPRLKTNNGTECLLYQMFSTQQTMRGRYCKVKKLLGYTLGAIFVLTLSGAAFAQGFDVGAGYWFSSTSGAVEGEDPAQAITGNAIMLYGDYSLSDKLGLGVLYTGLTAGAVHDNVPGMIPVGEVDTLAIVEGLTPSQSYLRLSASYNLFPGSTISVAPLVGYVRTGTTINVDPEVMVTQSGPPTHVSFGFSMAGYAVGASATAELGGGFVAKGTAAYLLGLTGSWAIDMSGPYEGEPPLGLPLAEGGVTWNTDGVGPITGTGLEIMGSIGYRVTPDLIIEGGYRSLSVNHSAYDGEVTEWIDWNENGALDEGEEEYSDSFSGPGGTWTTSGFFVGARYRF